MSNAGGVSGLTTDAAANLWVVDSGNSRILEFFTPLKITAVSGSGDEVADRVIGQGADFAKNACNQGATANAKTLVPLSGRSPLTRRETCGWRIAATIASWNIALRWR